MAGFFCYQFCSTVTVVGKSHKTTLATTKFSGISYLFRANVFYMVEQKVYYWQVNCKNSPILCFNNSTNGLLYLPIKTHQIGVHANVTDKTVRITVHQIYIYRPIIPPTSNIVDNAPDWNVSKQCEPISVEHFIYHGLYII